MSFGNINMRIFFLHGLFDLHSPGHRALNELIIAANYIYHFARKDQLRDLRLDCFYDSSQEIAYG